jgi:hypothetical protein
MDEDEIVRKLRITGIRINRQVRHDILTKKRYPSSRFLRDILQLDFFLRYHTGQSVFGDVSDFRLDRNVEPLNEETDRENIPPFML